MLKLLKTSLRARLTVVVLVMSLVPLALVTALLSQRFRQQLVSQVEATLKSEAEGASGVIESAFVDSGASVRSWTEQAIIKGALSFDAYDKSDAVFATLQKRYPQFKAIVLFKPDGEAVSANDPSLVERFKKVGADALLQRTWFQNALKEQMTSEGIEQEDPVLGGHVIHFALPVRGGEDGKIVGVLMAAYDWATMDELVGGAIKRSSQRAHRSFSMAISRADGTVLYNSDRKEQLTLPDLKKYANESSGTFQLGNRVVAFAQEGDVTKDVGDDFVFFALLDTSEAFAPVNDALSLALMLAAVLAGLVVVATAYFAGSMTAPIISLTQVVTKIVETGDLTQRIDVAREDEVGLLARNFASLVEKLRSIPLTLKDAVSGLSQAVEAIAAMTSEQSTTLAKQAAALQETGTTAREIQEVAGMAASKAAAVNDVATRAQAIGQAGQRSMEDSLTGLDQIQANVQRITEHIGALSERTGQVAEITETVKELADQSKVLALNAAIEATKAGEHGKGFGVVAREIRALATQSIGSTVRVREILSEVEGSIRTAVDSTKLGREQVLSSVGQVRSGGENIQKLAAVVDENSAAAKQIAAAVAQQNAGISQIFVALTDLNGMMNESVGALKQTNDAAQELRKATSQVAQILGSFRV